MAGYLNKKVICTSIMYYGCRVLVHRSDNLNSQVWRYSRNPSWQHEKYSIFLWYTYKWLQYIYDVRWTWNCLFTHIGFDQMHGEEDKEWKTDMPLGLEKWGKELDDSSARHLLMVRIIQTLGGFTSTCLIALEDWINVLQEN